MSSPNADVAMVDGFEALSVHAGKTSMLQFVGNDRLKHWADNFEQIEPETLAWIDSFPDGSTLYDLGASIGNFSIYAAIGRKASVYAFEPEIQNFSTLGINHFLNRGQISSQFVPINMALSNFNGVGQIHMRMYGAGEHVKTLGAPVLQDTKQEFEATFVQPITCARLDDVVSMNDYPPPTHIKIDVDGSELKAIEGAPTTLALPSLRSIMIELSCKGGELTQASDALQSFGFEEIARSPVVNLRGGFYDDLFNVEFEKKT